jgi:hypothetical protein
MPVRLGRARGAPVASRWVLDRNGTAEEAVLEINSDITERNLSIQRLKDSDSRTQAILAEEGARSRGRRIA